MSAEGEVRLYSECVKAGITMLSIGHRPALKRFHSLVGWGSLAPGPCSHMLHGALPAVVARGKWEVVGHGGLAACVGATGLAGFGVHCLGVCNGLPALQAVHFEGVGAGKGWRLEELRASDREGLLSGGASGSASSAHWTMGSQAKEASTGDV